MSPVWERKGADASTHLVAGLNDSDALARPGQRHRGRQSRYSGTHDGDVVLRCAAHSSTPVSKTMRKRAAPRVNRANASFA